MDKELDKLKYEIYKKSKKRDYLTFRQFIENQKVAYTFGELENRQKIKSEKRVKKDLKNDKKGLYNGSNS